MTGVVSLSRLWETESRGQLECAPGTPRPSPPLGGLSSFFRTTSDVPKNASVSQNKAQEEALAISATENHALERRGKRAVTEDFV